METATRQQLTPMLGVHDAAGAIDFYTRAFGAVENGERHEDEGKIGHAQLRIGDAIVMLADEYPGHSSTPTTLGGTPVILHLDVEDVDKVTSQAVHAGADLIRAPEDFLYGRISKVRDPYGHVWMLNGPCAH